MLDIYEVMKVLKHRYPFLLVDRVIECDADHAVGYKNVTINEPFFQGHFPGEPVMPGVLILEAMGQVGSIMATAQIDKESIKDKIVFLTGIDKAKFRKPVRPGDRIMIKAKMLKRRPTVGKARIEAFVDEELIAEAEFLFFVAQTLKKHEQEEFKL
ncbi:MAG: 3-hydroxyacyl-ACP dehydratase FabZ [Synergistaceae bacterium]|nr:3-hydroxyacyl-ACP dehydratase FabZ [Synergistaceae bacterium]